MKRLSVIPALLLLAAPLLAQAPNFTVPGSNIPTLRPPFARENQLMETGGFELPRVKGRVPKEAKEGNFIRFSQGEWVEFASNEAANKGGVKVGLSNETARTGRQSLYVNFDHVKERQAAVRLASSLIPVKPTKSYHIGIWGRIDKRAPLTLDQRAPVLRVEIEFYQADEETQTGETIIKVQPIPGTPNRPLYFTSDRWTEYWTEQTAPEDAAFIKIAYIWSTTIDEGMTNGVIYFDDATLEGEKVEVPDDPEPTTETTPGAPPVATPVPVAPAQPVPAPAPPK